MKNKTISLSASDLVWLLPDCPRCFWLKCNKIWYRPFTPFPSIFSKIDRHMRIYFEGEDASKIGLDGRITSGTKIEQVIKFNDGQSLRLCGIPDLLVERGDYSVYIVDMKTSEPKPGNIELYRPQLHFYYHLLHSAHIEVAGLYLYSIEPVGFGEGSEAPLRLDFRPTLQEIPIDREWWRDFLGNAINLIFDPEPKPSPKCPHCNKPSPPPQ